MGCSLSILVSRAQDAKSGFWTRVDNASLRSEAFKNDYKPENFITFKLNESAVQTELRKVPSEKSIVAGNSSFIFRVPNSKGEMESYRVTEASVMEPSLAAKYPGIKSYAGKGIEHPQSTIRFDISPLGFHAMIISPDRKTIYINPVDKSNRSYIVFDREGLRKDKQSFDCVIDEAVNNQLQASKIVKTGSIDNLNASDGKLRQYRLALCTSGEYSVAALNGATGTDAEKKAIILAILNTNLTRANGIYERDFGIRMVLVANNDQIIYLDASTDPWTSSSVWNSATQTTCTNVIGSANYDVGHLLMYGGNNGNAGCIGCVCTSSSKGSGWTSYSAVQGDPFVVDYWTHELGHQFGGNHTFTHSIEGTIAQVEPGSGSTIMGYAGITGATDVQPHSDDYFHAISIQQITDYTQTGNGAGCAVSTLTGNNIPTANAGLDYTIPKSTPFTLTGTGTDADAADVLTYGWEQMDVYGTSSNSSTYPTATKTKGPAFRSYLPTTGNSRTFPQLSSILDGTNGNKWEVLPSVARTLNFRLTVKDNRTGGGGNKSDNMIVTISSTAGPFAVTSPNTAITWGSGTSQTVTWNVASSNASPVNCANVNILLSTDGGQTFSTVLASNTPNDGSQLVTLPSIESTTCRIKVESVGNIFFDISNANFGIGTPPACADPSGLASSAITSSGATVSWTAVSGASSYAVDYKLNTSGTWISAATATTATSLNLTGLTAASLYDWRVRTNCSSSNSNYVSAQFTTATASTCPSTYDNSSNGTFSGAVAIPLNTDVKGLINTTSDLDYYKFTFVTGGTITVTLSTLPKDYDLRLYNSAQTQVGISQNSGTTSETINYTVAAGTYYARVNGYNGARSTTLCYTLRVTTGTAAKTGTEIAGDSFNKLYPNPAQSVINISITKVPSGAVIKVYDVNGKQVIRNTVTQKDMQIDVRKLMHGMYFIKVEDASGEVYYSSKFLRQ